MSIKVVTLFIHVNRHSEGTHETHERFPWNGNKNCAKCRMGYVLRNEYMCTSNIPMLLVLPKNKKIRQPAKDVYSIRNGCKCVCQSHAPEYRKLDVQIMFEPVIFPQQNDIDRLQFNEFTLNNAYSFHSFVWLIIGACGVVAV